MKRLFLKIFLVIFILHVSWFLYFVFANFSDAFEITAQKTRVIILIGILVLAILIYFKWLRKNERLNKILILTGKGILWIYIVFFFYFIYGIFFNPLITFTQIGSVLQGNGLHRNYISFADMGPNIKLAVIASEDQLFPDHDGFDLNSIKLAMKYNKRHPGKPARGASTISQQTAKNVFLWQARTPLRKSLEVFCTFTIETGWSKKTILERYLNIAEMGRGIFGIQAAARKYFNKNAKDLTRAEAAQIAASLPNPKVYTLKPLSAYVANHYENILEQMNNLEGDGDVEDLVK